MEMFFTVLSGVLIFVLGQFMLKVLVEPVQELKKEITAILSSIVYYADIYSNPGIGEEKNLHEASYTLRKHASELSSKASIIPFYGLLYFLRILPNKEDISNAKENLIGLSNSVGKSAESQSSINSKRADEIEKSLKFHSEPYFLNFVAALFVIGFIIFLFNNAIDKSIQMYCEHNITKTKED